MAKYSFVIATEDSGVSQQEMIQQGLAAIEAAIKINVMHFERNPQDICALACGKIRYDSKNADALSLIGEISTVPVLIERGVGLCIDIVAFDVAAKIYEGLNVWPHIFSRGGGIFHVITQGISETGQVIQYDPSAELKQRGYVVSNQPASCRR